MAIIERCTFRLDQLTPNPDNPRTITQKDIDETVKSITDFPEMMQVRSVVVDENGVILGGNLRYLAHKQAGLTNIEAIRVIGWTPEQKREFVIKDNGSFGSWDFDALANEWSDLPLADWGVSIPPEWESLPELEKPLDDLLKDTAYTVTITFQTGKDRDFATSQVRDLIAQICPTAHVE